MMCDVNVMLVVTRHTGLPEGGDLRVRFLFAIGSGRVGVACPSLWSLVHTSQLTEGYLGFRGTPAILSHRRLTTPPLSPSPIVATAPTMPTPVDALPRASSTADGGPSPMAAALLPPGRRSSPSSFPSSLAPCSRQHPLRLLRRRHCLRPRRGARRRPRPPQVRSPRRARRSLRRA